MLAAGDWAIAQYMSWGVDAKREDYRTWRGWRRGVSHIDLVAPRTRSLEGAMLAWRPGTKGKPLKAEAIILGSAVITTRTYNPSRVTAFAVRLGIRPATCSGLSAYSPPAASTTRPLGKEFRYVIRRSTRRTQSPARDTPSAEIHPSTEIESRRPHGVATVARDGRAVHCGVGESAVREEQAGVECDAAIEEVLNAAAERGGVTGEYSLVRVRRLVPDAS
jgi:hypothetical protein